MSRSHLRPCNERLSIVPRRRLPLRSPGWSRMCETLHLIPPTWMVLRYRQSNPMTFGRSFERGILSLSLPRSCGHRQRRKSLNHLLRQRNLYPMSLPMRDITWRRGLLFVYRNVERSCYTSLSPMDPTMHRYWSRSNPRQASYAIIEREELNLFKMPLGWKRMKQVVMFCYVQKNLDAMIVFVGTS